MYKFLPAACLPVGRVGKVSRFEYKCNPGIYT